MPVLPTKQVKDENFGSYNYIDPASNSLTATLSEIDTVIGSISNYGIVKSFSIDGQGSPIETGLLQDWLYFPAAWVIKGWTVITDVSGSITFDIWKEAYPTFPTSASNSISGTEKPLTSSSRTGQDDTLTTWTTNVPAGSILMCNLDVADGVVTKGKVFLYGDPV